MTLVRPELLFLVGGILAVSPYVTWFLFGKNPDYVYSVGGIPAAYWVFGYVSFFIGSMKWFPSRRGKVEMSLIHSVVKWRTTELLLILCIGLMIQMYFVISLYGGIPILLFLTGGLDVESVNQTQLESGFGQIGFLFLTLVMLHGLLLIEIIRASTSGAPRPIRIFSLIVIIFLIHLFAGKRQGVFIASFFIYCGLSISVGNPFSAFLRAVGLRVTRARIIAFCFTLTIVLIAVFEITGSLRTQNVPERRGFELFTYVELPLINMEAQSEQTGFMPKRLDLPAIFSSLLPAKIRDEVNLGTNLPTLPEPTAPTGFFGPLQWFGGILIAGVFSFGTGIFCKWLFNKSRSSLTALLCYSQVSWALVSAHTYNHFLNLIFIPLPMLSFLILAWLIDGPISGRSASHRELARTRKSVESFKGT